MHAHIYVVSHQPYILTNNSFYYHNDDLIKKIAGLKPNASKKCSDQRVACKIVSYNILHAIDYMKKAYHNNPTKSTQQKHYTKI